MSQVVSLELEVAQLIVEALNLEVDPSAIEVDAPLYGEGLGLDSIDMLELSLAISKKYGFQLRSDDKDNVRIFSSLRALAEAVGARRTK
ncbi:MAG: phosphopantetheine-binding protein [Betaproteobacteria bacterium]|nr:phosphopantetheine-binding protein [Betaproteobacteria bacterium]